MQVQETRTYLEEVASGEEDKGYLPSLLRDCIEKVEALIDTLKLENARLEADAAQEKARVEGNAAREKTLHTQELSEANSTIKALEAELAIAKAKLEVERQKVCPYFHLLY
jgi:hypothetical protein